MSKHHDAIRGPRWDAAKAACKGRDGHACIWCGATEALEVDHIIELHTLDLDADDTLAYDLDNLRTLCTACHDLRHGTDREAGERRRL